MGTQDRVRVPVSDGSGAENEKDRLLGAGVAGVVEPVASDAELGEGSRGSEEGSEVEEGYIGSEEFVAGDADLEGKGDSGGKEVRAAAPEGVPCGGNASGMVMATQDRIRVPVSIGSGAVNEKYMFSGAGVAGVVEQLTSIIDLGEGARGSEGFVAGDADLGGKRDSGGKAESAAANKGVPCGGNASGGHQMLHDEGDEGMEEGQILEDMEADMDLSESPVRELDGKDPSAAVSQLGTVASLETKYEILASNQNYTAVSGNKRARMTYDEQQPSVHVSYNSLTRASKRKLEELLQQWSEWHVRRDSSYLDLNEGLESGENTYFPALRIGLEKSSSVLFWMENQTNNKQSRNVNSPDGNSVPFYDREYALGLTSEDGRSNIEGGLEIVGDPSRCFNCGAYNHSLKECPKPRDIAAVNSARNQMKLKKMQNSGSRNASRYYQNSSGGKYDGLKPGVLDTETRKALGLGELDPPPWLFRMKELGYPPGYLDPDEDDQPSGITIFADGDAEEEDGEISGKVSTEPKKKMSVEFPGVNAPIPENADKEIWTSGPSGSDPPRSRSNHRPTHFSESYSRWRPQEDRRRMDVMDDGPPGVDPPYVDSLLSPSSASYPPRYSSYDSGPRRSSYDRNGRGTLVYEDFISHSPRDSYRGKHVSPLDYGSSRHSYGNDRLRDDDGLDYQPRRSHEYDRYHHHGRR